MDTDEDETGCCTRFHVPASAPRQRELFASGGVVQTANKFQHYKISRVKRRNVHAKTEHCTNQK